SRPQTRPGTTRNVFTPVFGTRSSEMNLYGLGNWSGSMTIAVVRSRKVEPSASAAAGSPTLAIRPSAPTRNVKPEPPAVLLLLSHQYVRPRTTVNVLGPW